MSAVPLPDGVHVITYSQWCAERGTDHAHCPDWCEHPQPLVLDDGRCVCGRCLIVFGEQVEVVPCTPETCPDG